MDTCVIWYSIENRSQLPGPKTDHVDYDGKGTAGEALSTISVRMGAISSLTTNAGLPLEMTCLSDG